MTYLYNWIYLVKKKKKMLFFRYPWHIVDNIIFFFRAMHFRFINECAVWLLRQRPCRSAYGQRPLKAYWTGAAAAAATDIEKRKQNQLSSRKRTIITQTWKKHRVPPSGLTAENKYTEGPCSRYILQRRLTGGFYTFFFFNDRLPGIRTQSTTHTRAESIYE